MKRWHESLAANIGLRTGGSALIVLGSSVAVRLHQLALATSGRDSSSFMMLLAAIVFLCASAGSALLFVGPGLWEIVEVSERWRRVPAGAVEVPAHPGNGHGEIHAA
ncbi:hypothetical protein SAMN05428974_0420 [Sphingopyxis sp. YR583]|uniref:hypothetical protein n=1 Tax=Sphingopyxis sp. YR583 TaxID=1881047 RepID=UPI0008A7753D|nr:hypothetical protein [Sphingopyxis sp. YR583]SEH12226.1 hypothetical protein SAMN05428974_0420 [Sphingopyxis sp. YR583]